MALAYKLIRRLYTGLATARLGLFPHRVEERLAFRQRLLRPLALRIGPGDVKSHFERDLEIVVAEWFEYGAESPRPSGSLEPLLVKFGV